jgi:peptidoglycan-associated lipoprotein
MPRRLRAPILLAVVLPTLLSAGCKKKTEEEPEPVVAVQEVTTAISVVSISPARTPENAAVTATLRGAGFERGAEVFVGPEKAFDVQFLDENSLRLTVPALAVGRYDVEAVNPDGASSVLRQGFVVEAEVIACESATVYFDVASSTLTSESQATLEANLSCYQEYSSNIKIEGHCDERGTTDYNLALGQRRADAVKRKLTADGVAMSRISTVSYGEERPVDSGHDEAAWNKNRRAEIQLGK